MSKIFLAFILTAVAFGQGAGTIVNNSKVTATAGPLVCEGIPTNRGNAVAFNCKSGVSVLAAGEITPEVGATSGVVFSVSVGSDNITCTFRRPTENERLWSCAANGTVGQGTF